MLKWFDYAAGGIECLSIRRKMPNQTCSARDQQGEGIDWKTINYTTDKHLGKLSGEKM